ncbi:hypothetical protein AAG570_005378 [Ranatra chinensis]|uniref:Dynein heavy chain linker domain-containing protein n=1 Tax=Ranatra chinensis TaxID=642074 RepID=A0ABD0YM19_9HEMI
MLGTLSRFPTPRVRSTPEGQAPQISVCDYHAEGPGFPKRIIATLMFDNVGALNFKTDGEGRLTATAMISCENEVMDFREAVVTAGRVENWMCDVMAEMRRSNWYITKFAIHNYGTVQRPSREWMDLGHKTWGRVAECRRFGIRTTQKIGEPPLKTNLALTSAKRNRIHAPRPKIMRTEWMIEFLGMVCLAGNGVWWTAEVENVFDKFKLVNDHRSYILYNVAFTHEYNVPRIPPEDASNMRSETSGSLSVYSGRFVTSN